MDGTERNGKRLCSVLLSVWLCCTPALCSAEEAYLIYSGELTRLERNLTELRDINDRQSRESVTLKNQLKESLAQLTEARKQSQTLKEQLAGLKLTVSEQGSSLQNANRLLKQYEEEEKFRQRKIKRQRNIAYVIAAVSIYIAVRKAN